jgi:hypothetical protein
MIKNWIENPNDSATKALLADIKSSGYLGNLDYSLKYSNIGNKLMQERTLVRSGRKYNT